MAATIARGGRVTALLDPAPSQLCSGGCGMRVQHNTCSRCSRRRTDYLDAITERPTDREPEPVR